MVKLLTTKAVREILPVSTVTLWRLVRDGKLPKPIKLTPNSPNLYREEWITDYIDSVDVNQL